MNDKQRPPVEKRWWFQPALDFLQKLLLNILNKKKK